MNTKRAVDLARAFAQERFSEAVAVFLGGSWASGRAHIDSDLDIVILDAIAETVSFEGLEFLGVIVEVCVIPSGVAEAFFRESAKYRSAPVPAQVANGLVVSGNNDIAENVRRAAKEALARGPAPLTESERFDLRYDITVLREDLSYASPEALISLAAFAHTQLSRAVLDATGAWRAERKALRRAVIEVDPEFADQLDKALVQACRGEREPMIALCTLILECLGGPQRTYPRFSA